MVRDGRFETANPVQAALKNSQPIRCPPGDVPIKCVRVHSIHMPTAQCCERLMRQISVYPPVNVIYILLCPLYLRNVERTSHLDDHAAGDHSDDRNDQHDLHQCISGRS